MVDEFACVWPIVALEGVGDLIGDARPGLVAVDGGRRLGWANPAAGTLFLAPTLPGAPLALDRRLADRIVRFAERAAPGEEARELLRFVAADRPILRTVVFRRPIDSDDAVIAVVDAAASADLGTVAAGLAPFAADGGLAALFDAEGGVLGAVGDLDVAETLVEEIEAALAEADEIAVLERTLVTASARHRLVLVRLGDRPDARRLLRLSSAEAIAVSAAEATPPAAEPVATPVAAEPVAAPVAVDAAADEPIVFPDAVAPPEDHPAPAPIATIEPATATIAAPETAGPAATESTAADTAIDEDRFVAAPPLPFDLFTEFDETEDELDRAWRIEAEAADTPSTTAEPVGSDAAPERDAPLAEPAETSDTPAPTVATAATDTAEAEPAIVADDADRLPAETLEAAPADRPLAAAEEPLPLVAHGEPDDARIEALLPEPQPIATATPDATPAPLAELPLESSAEPEVVSEPETVSEPPHETVAAPPAPDAITAHDRADDTIGGARSPDAAFVFTPLERPVKFVWQMDADRRFTLVSDEFADIVGPAAADIVGRPWDEVAARLGLDREGVIGRALSRRDTWSGRSVLWPVEGTAMRIPVDLAALPAFDRGRTFVGFRGFGTCRTDAPLPDPLAVGLRLSPPRSSAPVAVEAALDGAIATADTAPVTAPETLADRDVATDEDGARPTPVLSDAAPTPSELPHDDTSTLDPATPADAPAVACVVETLAEPPLFPDDRESAEDEVDHPIEPAFAGDIGDDPLFHREAERAETTPAADAGTEIAGSEPPEDVPTAAPGISPATEARPAPHLVALPKTDVISEDAVRLSVPERNAFRQIARALGARIEGEAEDDAAPAPAPRAAVEPARPRPTPPVADDVTAIDTRLLDRLPLAVALLRDDTLIHANERFLTLLRYPDLSSLRAAGGVDALFAGPHAARRFETADGRPMALIAHDGTVVPCDARITAVPLAEGSGLLLTLNEHAAARPATAPTPSATPAPAAAAPAADTADREHIDELRAIVDTATDGVLMLDASGLVLSANAGAEALFGVERRAMIGRPLTDRLAPESRRSAMDYLDGLAANGVASVLNDGREVIGVVAPEGLIPLFMTVGRVSTGPIAKYCAVLRDITQWKKSEEELTAARRRAEESSIHKSDFLAKISHEIRTPLNAIIGFSELMLDERFGPIGSERYKDYLRDIHVSGSHIMSLVNDLLDLSKVEAGKMDLRFEAVPLAEVVSECVALMQPQANRERIIIRSSLPAGVPPVVADPRSMRQVVLNLLSNAVKFTPAGGQVIVSITLEDNGEVVLRVRDTGYGMSEKELQTALEPFRQLHTTRSRSGGTGLGLPLTKALTEANRATFRIDSTVGQGTLVSVAFPVTRVLAG